MKFSYPTDKLNLTGKDVKQPERIESHYGQRNKAGYYPIGKALNWHGGIHIEGKGQDIRAIADGVIVAYRMLDEAIVFEQKDEKNSKKIESRFSNAFVLIQHRYISPEGRVLVFYSLYMHLMDIKNIKEIIKKWGKKNSNFGLKYLPKPFFSQAATVTHIENCLYYRIHNKSASRIGYIQNGTIVEASAETKLSYKYDGRDKTMTVREITKVKGVVYFKSRKKAGEACYVLSSRLVKDGAHYCVQGEYSDYEKETLLRVETSELNSIKECVITKEKEKEAKKKTNDQVSLKPNNWVFELKPQVDNISDADADATKKEEVIEMVLPEGVNIYSSTEVSKTTWLDFLEVQVGPPY